MKKFLVISVYSVLALGTLLIYWQVRNFEFVNYDDIDYVTDNPQVLNGLRPDGVIGAFTSSHSANWHPMTWLSLMLDCQLFGASAGWMHFVNLIFHILNTLLLFGVLKKLTGCLWPSAFVAAAFAIHPMHVESVAWIAERKDVLSTFFLLLTLGAYVRYVRSRGLFSYLMALLLFVLGLLAKPMLVTLPFLLLLLDYWPLNRFSDQKIKTKKNLPVINRREVLRRVIVEKIPFFVLAAGLSVVTFLVQRAGGAVTDINNFALRSRIGNAFLSYIRYIGKMFWPENLAVFYPLDVRTIQSWQVVLCVLLLLGVSVFVIWFGRNRRYLPVGWFWFIGTLVPVIGIVQVGEQSMAERYSYIPYIGLFVMIAWGMGELLSKWRYRKIVLGAAAIIVLAAIGTVTYRQVSYWKNSFTLFTHTLEVTQNNYVIYNYLGVVYCNLGRYQEEIEACNQAIKIRPDYAKAHHNLGVAYGGLGRWQEAIEAYTRAIRIRPNYAVTYYNLGAAYSSLGRYQEAIEAFKGAITVKADYAEAYNNLGVAYGCLGRHLEATEAFNQAIRIKADYAEAHNNLGVAYGNLGRVREELEAFKQAIRVKPDYANAHYNLGVAYLIAGEKGLAFEEYKILKNLSPEQANKLFPAEANTPTNAK